MKLHWVAQFSPYLGKLVIGQLPLGWKLNDNDCLQYDLDDEQAMGLRQRGKHIGRAICAGELCDFYTVDEPARFQ